MSEPTDPSVLMAAAKCYRCPEEAATGGHGSLVWPGAMPIYTGVAWANEGVPPQLGFVFGNPDEDWAFGDPGTGDEFGAP